MTHPQFALAAARCFLELRVWPMAIHDARIALVER